MYVGVDYYPEHWPRERWDIDADLMRQSHFNIVRLAEFAWSKFEPEEGKFDFAWLDDALDVLGKRGIKAILGTPTAVIPAWMARKYPEVMAMEKNGVRQTWGCRKNTCFNAGAFRLLSERVVKALALHYKGHPNVIGWQTDNEFEGPMCYCETCRVDFQEWLRAKYGSLAELNRAWGTHFWGLTYSEFAEIPLPIDPPHIDIHNPSMYLDWLRYHTWRNVKYQRDQVEILREYCPDHFITHNMMGFGNFELSPFDFAEDLDFAALDNYPIWGDFTIPYDAAAAGDLTRGLKGKNYWIMETTAGPHGWPSFGRNPYPGEIRKVAFQQMAHGADGHLWFRWRTCTAGREQYWHGLLGHDGKPGRRLAEAAQTAEEYHKLADEIAGTTVQADVAIIFDYDSRMALRTQPGFDKNDYQANLMRYHRALFRAGVNVDIVSTKTDLSAYKVVITPELHVLPDAYAERLDQFVAEGGILLADIRTGVKNETNLCHDRTLPGLLSKALGITIDEYGSNPYDYKLKGKIGHQEFTSHQYSDWITLDTAEALVRFDGHWHMGDYPAVTRNRYGKGIGYYVGTVVKEDSFYDAVMEAVLDDAKIAPVIKPPAGVEVSVRKGNGKEIVFVMNHNEDSITIDAPAGYIDLLANEKVDRIQLDRFGVSVLKRSNA